MIHLRLTTECLISRTFMIFYCADENRLKCGRRHKKSRINFHNIWSKMSAVVVGQEKRRKLGWDSRNMEAFTRRRLFLPSSRACPEINYVFLCEQHKTDKKHTQTFSYWSPAFFVPTPARCLSETSFAAPRRRNTCWLVHKPRNGFKQTPLAKLRALDTQSIKHLFKITNRSA